MKINFKSTTQYKLSGVIALTFYKELEPTCKCNETSALYSKAHEVLEQTTTFEGESGQSDCITVELDSDIYKVIAIGLGDKDDINTATYRSAGGRLADTLICHKLYSSDVILAASDENICEFAYALASKTYRFNKYFVDKLDSKVINLKEITVYTLEAKKIAEKFNFFKGVLSGVFETRDLVSEPASTLYPATFAKRCGDLKSLGVKVNVLKEKDLLKKGMNCILAVGQGSDKESMLVSMEYNGNKASKEKIAFVGKGITFDSGGINIKPSLNMGDMKYDMGGAGVVTGLMRSLAERKAKVNVVGIIALAENMPSGSAQRPSDVIKSMNGQTVEVDNTDAEGRLVLADALCYVQQQFKPSYIIDLATLTGAVVVALGDGNAGLFSNDDKLADMLLDASKHSGEGIWRLPLSSHYDGQINSEIADVRNTGTGSGAGATTAAQFLQRFIENDTKWAHLDIAGMTWMKGSHAYIPKGATGFGVALLNSFLQINFEPDA